MLELVYLNLFDYLARPNGSEPIARPDDFSVAVAMAEADKVAIEEIKRSAERALTRRAWRTRTEAQVEVPRPWM
jgi:hypothetical protein